MQFFRENYSSPDYIVVLKSLNSKSKPKLVILHQYASLDVGDYTLLPVLVSD